MIEKEQRLLASRRNTRIGYADPGLSREDVHIDPVLEELDEMQQEKCHFGM